MWRRGLLIAAALLVIAVTARLGWWQLSRADEKLAWQTAIAERAQLPALGASALEPPLSEDEIAARLHRRADLRGRWLPERTVFLDNRMMDHKSGFYVLTPLVPQGSNAAVLVVRGWVARDAQDRARLPVIETSGDEVDVSGLVILRPPPTFALGAESTGPIRQNLDLVAYAQETGLSLAPVMVQQLGPAADGLLRNWPEPGSGVETNYGYAVQWFGLCILVLALLLWFQIVRPLRASRHDQARG